MKPIRPGTLLLRAYIGLCRIGPIRAGAALLCLAALAGWFWLLPQMHAQQAQQQASLAQLRHTSAAPAPVQAAPRPLAEKRLADFEAMLAETRYAEQQVATLFAIAAKSGLDLARADYKLVPERDGGFQRYQIVLPVSGSYAAIHDFCRLSLLAMPFAALTEVAFKRGNIASATVEARLSFTIFLSDRSSAPGRHE